MHTHTCKTKHHLLSDALNYVSLSLQNKKKQKTKETIPCLHPFLLIPSVFGWRGTANSRVWQMCNNTPESHFASCINFGAILQFTPWVWSRALCTHRFQRMDKTFPNDRRVCVHDGAVQWLEGCGFNSQSWDLTLAYASRRPKNRKQQLRLQSVTLSIGVKVSVDVWLFCQCWPLLSPSDNSWLIQAVTLI